MEITHALAADLAELGEALHEPGVDVTAEMRKLGADVKAAVRSFLGLSITLQVDGESVTLTGLEADAEHAQVLSSLAIPLRSLNPASSTGQLVLYAARSGAFVDFAADLSWATGAEQASFVLDRHRNVDLAAPQLSGLSELSAINQAVGVLLDKGHPPEHARAELDRRARQARLDPAAFALNMLTALTRPPETHTA